jgi:hypothetical protein
MGLNTLLSNMWILVVGGVVLTLFIVWRAFASVFKGQKDARRLLQTGIPAAARIVQVQPTGTTVSTGGHRNLQCAVMLEVHRQNGAPYQTQLITLISEFQIPQYQPGAVVQVRYDGNDPAKVAIAALGGTLPGQPAATPAAGAPAWTPQPVAVSQFKMPAGAIIGVVLGLIGAGVGVYVALVNSGGFSSLAPEPSAVCGKAVACCQKVAEKGGSKEAAAACENFKKIGVPDMACQQALDGFKKSAEALKATCE